ncbi:unnamed protein product [Paramecium sonneborni]|uniref:Uncharacterized protein n=1 Tax=Paramecium sonneborni TaxID=65129 RepID=A0A8S1QBD6_9CILI|nr:unnamed protein product [Paramecium sonneborni]
MKYTEIIQLNYKGILQQLKIFYNYLLSTIISHKKAIYKKKNNQNKHHKTTSPESSNEEYNNRRKFILSPLSRRMSQMLPINTSAKKVLQEDVLTQLKKFRVIQQIKYAPHAR